MSQSTGSAGVKRREFLKVLGAASAVTTTIGCSQEKVEKLIPYLVSPDQTVPGVSTYYSSTCRECATACGVVAEVRDGRAIKLEGNPDHPVNHGALCARGQAALQGLYNPDRYRQPMVREGGKLVPTTWDKAVALLSQKVGEVRSKGGAGNVVFIDQHQSGSFGVFLDQWLGAFGFPAHDQYDSGADLAVRAANTMAYGVAMPTLEMSAASLVISLGADFLDGRDAAVPMQLAFADARAKLQNAPRFIYIGPRRSLTGLNADEWIACKPGSEEVIANALLAAVGGTGASIKEAADASGVTEATLQRLADELKAARPSLVLSGVSTPNAGVVATIAANINKAAGNVGVTVKPSEPLGGYSGAVGAERMAAIAQQANAGNVPLLFVRGANPAYDTPKAAGFAAAMAKIPFKVSFSSYPDETTELCDLVMPSDHSLESWGDAEAKPGVISLQQPVMDRIFDTRATADVLLQVAQGDPTTATRFPWKSYRDYLVSRFPGGTAAFTQALSNGMANGTIAQRDAANAKITVASTAPAPIAGDGEYYLVTYPHAVLGDGSGGPTKPWLQELPDPVAKVLWQSWVELHPTTAKKLGVQAGDHVTVQTAAGEHHRAGLHLSRHPAGYRGRGAGTGPHRVRPLCEGHRRQRARRVRRNVQRFRCAGLHAVQGQGDPGGRTLRPGDDRRVGAPARARDRAGAHRRRPGGGSIQGRGAQVPGRCEPRVPPRAALAGSWRRPG
jgi:anaerobic selenocysteine-containing dehydrogenase